MSLHGVKTVEIAKGLVGTGLPKTAVIGIVGTASKNLNPQTPVLINSMENVRKHFGSGGTIPAAVEAIFNQGGATVFAVNVSIGTRGTEDGKTVFSGIKYKKGVIDLAAADEKNRYPHLVRVEVASGSTILKEGVDYTVDYHSGIIRRNSTAALPAEIALNLTLYRVENYDITGWSGDERIKKAFESFEKGCKPFGYNPKLLIAPHFSEKNENVESMRVTAHQLGAMAIVDIPEAADFETAKDTHLVLEDERVVVCYPYVTTGKNAKGEDINLPYSSYLAGVIAARDVERGFWWSPSNKEIKGITGVSKDLTAMINDEESEVNLLNELGIVTVFKSFGTGYRAWGNKSKGAAYPTNFISVRRTADVIHEALQKTMKQFMNRTIDLALLDDITESVNAFMRMLKGKGALTSGKCKFNPYINDAADMAEGKLKFTIEFTSAAPAETITFESCVWGGGNAAGKKSTLPFKALLASHHLAPKTETPLAGSYCADTSTGGIDFNFSPIKLSAYSYVIRVHGKFWEDTSEERQNFMDNNKRDFIQFRTNDKCLIWWGHNIAVVFDDYRNFLRDDCNLIVGVRNAANSKLYLNGKLLQESTNEIGDVIYETIHFGHNPYGGGNLHVKGAYSLILFFTRALKIDEMLEVEKNIIPEGSFFTAPLQGTCYDVSGNSKHGVATNITWEKQDEFHYNFEKGYGEGPELVVDGDMSSSGVNSWLSYWDAPLSKTSDSEKGQVLKVANNVSTDHMGAYQANRLEIGKRYRVSGWIKGEEACVGKYLREYMSLSTGRNFHKITDGWTHFDYCLPNDATSPAVSLYVVNIFENGSYYLKDVSVKEILIPSLSDDSGFVEFGKEEIENSNFTLWTDGKPDNWIINNESYATVQPISGGGLRMSSTGSCNIAQNVDVSEHLYRTSLKVKVINGSFDYWDGAEWHENITEDLDIVDIVSTTLSSRYVRLDTEGSEIEIYEFSCRKYYPVTKIHPASPKHNNCESLIDFSKIDGCEWFDTSDGNIFPGRDADGKLITELEAYDSSRPKCLHPSVVENIDTYLAESYRNRIFIRRTGDFYHDLLIYKKPVDRTSVENFLNSKGKNIPH